MKGFIFKVLVTLVLLLPTISMANGANKSKTYQAVGCMACHQSETMQADETSSKNPNDQGQEKPHTKQAD